MEFEITHLRYEEKKKKKLVRDYIKSLYPVVSAPMDQNFVFLLDWVLITFMNNSTNWLLSYGGITHNIMNLAQ